MSTTPVDTVCTDLQLADEVLGADNLNKLKPQDWSDFKQLRQVAFDEVLVRLRMRTPPVQEADLQDVTELRPAVIYGALAKAYRASMNSADEDDKYAAHAKTYQRMYEAEVRALQPTVAGPARSGPGAIAFHRR
jgi:hypothetical protein